MPRSFTIKDSRLVLASLSCFSLRTIAFARCSLIVFPSPLNVDPSVNRLDIGGKTEVGLCSDSRCVAHLSVMLLFDKLGVEALN